MCAIGLIFTTIDWYLLRDWQDRFILNAVWLIGWGLPSYVVGSFLQIIFLDEIATVLTRSRTPRQNQNLSSNIAEAVYGVILSSTFLAQTYVFSWMIFHLSPSFSSEYLSVFVNIIMISWATSFSAIECQLNIRAKNLAQRIDFCERNWAYALGFGLPAGLIYNLAPAVFATGIWQFSQLLLTFRQTSISPREIEESNKGVQALRIFKFAEVLANHLIYYLDLSLRFFF